MRLLVQSREEMVNHLHKELCHRVVMIQFIHISMVMIFLQKIFQLMIMTWMMITHLIIKLDLIQMTVMMIKSTSYQMIMDHHQMMILICQEYRTRGKHMIQVIHLQLRFQILTFQSSRLQILDKMTIHHQDLIRQLNLSEFKGNRDRFLLIQLMLYQRQRLR